MNKALSLIGGIGLGAGLMYILDPDRGNRRRALMRDKTVRAARKMGDAIDTTARDIRHRARGVVSEARSMFAKEEVPDDVLVARVRSKMGRVVSHPHSIEVTANRGRVTLSGPILESEVDNLLKSVWAVRGVTEVENKLEPHKEAGDIPGLQGGGYRPGDRIDLLQKNWSPTTRAIIGTAGALTTLYGARRRGILGTALGATGVGMLTTAITNMELKRLTGLGAGRRAIDIHKTMNISAPVEEVFKFWTNYENFPRFMTNVREVIDRGDGRSHWVVAGPAGVPVEWDAVITEMIPNKVLAWKSVPGSAIANAGMIIFKPNDDGTTNLDIKLSYNPPGGAMGHTVASLFGSYPKREMDEDLMRMKTFIETGTPPRDAAKPQASTREATTRNQ
ncbi:MAG TPA: SRPBCC family protein [Blastocatellia bacterium]|nr:SRPBCC family protein [Blastocatellia bacterium]